MNNVSNDESRQQDAGNRLTLHAIASDLRWPLMCEAAMPIRTTGGSSARKKKPQKPYVV